jgi:hypothetical protein
MLIGVICLQLLLEASSATIGVLINTLLGVELFMIDLSATVGDGDDLNKHRRV